MKTITERLEALPVGCTSVQAILAIACKHFGISEQQLRGERQYAYLSPPKQITAYLMRLQGVEFDTIGRAFHRDAKVAAYHYRNAMKLVESNQSTFMESIETIMREIERQATNQTDLNQTN